MNPLDPSSFANVHEIKSTHVHLQLSTDFESKILKGSVVHTAIAVLDNISEFILVI